MPLPHYSVFRGTVHDFHREGPSDPTPHFQLFVAGGGQIIRSAINVKSKLHPSQLAFVLDRNFRNPVTEGLASLDTGFTALPAAERRGLDYIRGNLFSLDDMVALPPHAPGARDDLQDIAESLCRSARDAGASVFVFGEPFPNGIHDVHQNQGNFGQFQGDNGVFQDGGLLVHFPAEDRWTALFLAFQSQAIHTDDQTGHPLAGAPLYADVISGGEPIPDEDRTEPRDEPAIAAEGLIRIIAALVNPIGGENQPDFRGRPESVTLLNTGSRDQPLDGWTIHTKSGSKPLDGLAIGAGDALKVVLGGAPALGNKGGPISLLNPQGLKIAGVSYTAEQAKEEGRTIVF